MLLYLASVDSDLLKKKIAAKTEEMAILGQKLGDAMSRSGSFPASNPEYAAVHLELKNLQNNIDSLKNVLNKYSIIEQDKIDLGTINTYSLVTLKDEATEKEIRYYIALAELGKKADGNCLFATPESPVGLALLGHKLGDLVQIKLPAGTKSYKVIEHDKVY